MINPGFIAVHYSRGRGAKGCARPTEAKRSILSAGDPERGSCAGGGHDGPGKGNVSADFEPLKGWEVFLIDIVNKV